jgi:ribosomal protein S18 acetylase RimI-like enzyme
LTLPAGRPIGAIKSSHSIQAAPQLQTPVSSLGQKIMLARDTDGVKIRELRPEHARQAAELHVFGISAGFISSLGVDFATALYEAIAASRFSFGLVAESGGKVVGFVVFTTDVNRLYWSTILRRGLRFMFLLAGKMFSVSRIRNVFETVFYPVRISKMCVPRAELLSIVVAPEQRGKGLSLMLTCEGLDKCRQRGIEKVKVLVGAANKSANGLYLKCGFELVGQIKNHGVTSNVYVARTDHFERH